MTYRTAMLTRHAELAADQMAEIARRATTRHHLSRTEMRAFRRAADRALGCLELMLVLANAKRVLADVNARERARQAKEQEDEAARARQAEAVRRFVEGEGRARPATLAADMAGAWLAGLIVQRN